MIAADKDYLATRVSYKLNLTGPSLNINTGCSTTLVAVHAACQSLLNGECDMALAGGVSLKVPQVAFKPDWTKHAKAAPFKRNDAMLDVLPVGVLVFPGNGIQENLADKAKKLGIPVMKFEKGA